MLLRPELHITWHHKCCKGSTIRLGTVIERYCHPSTCVTADDPTRSSQAADLWSCGVLFRMFALVSLCQARATCTTCRDHGPIIAMMWVSKVFFGAEISKTSLWCSKDLLPGHHVRSPLWISSFLRWFRCRGSGEGLGHHCQTHTWAVSKSRSINTPICRGLHPVRKESSLEISELDGTDS